MAELLAALLASPWAPPDLASSSPPPGLSPAVWRLRHELPLHLINFLRDQTEPLLAAQGAVPSPTKGSASRPSKYNYSSPLKSVVESPGKADPRKPDQGKKPKKKVKLFSSHKSFSEVEEVVGKVRGGVEGVDRLPATPSRPPMSASPRRAQDSRPRYSSANLSDQDTPPERTAGKMARRISARFTPSPQAFSLSDFLTPAESKKGRRGKQSRSPSKAKASTPVEGGEAPPTIGERGIGKVSNLGERLEAIDLESQEAFPEIGGTRRRRIKPIQVGQVPSAKNGPANSAFGKVVERSSAAESPFSVAEVERKTVDDRQMVKESVARQTPLKAASTVAVTPLKSVSRSCSVSSVSMAVASPLLVTHRPTLLLLVHIYTHILTNNLMPNLTVELYFLLELLLLEVAVDQELPPSELSFFTSLHNCVFFASQVLAGVAAGLVSVLDPTTLRLLVDNSRMAEFCPTVADTLTELLQTSTSSPPRPAGARALQNVSFQSETDNRSNFPSSASFHDFKKQRDRFYSLVRRWGEESRSPDYTFRQLVGDVEQVMAMLDNPVNYGHFARLFRQQLVAMCLGEGGVGQDEQVMADLRRADPVKYKRLAARLTTPGRGGGPCPTPSFAGASEFCRDFVVASRSHKFIQHLRDALATEIQRLDALPLDVGGEAWGSGLAGLEDSHLEVSREVGEDLAAQYQDTLLTLRVLAKFLGFLEALPYTSEEPLSEELAEAALGVRASPSILDLGEHVTAATTAGRLVLTLPWVIEMLSQLDQVSLALPRYRLVHLQLCVLYQARLLPGTPHLLPTSASLLSLLLGWLFEQPTFPRELLILARLQPEPEAAQEAASLDQAEVVRRELVAACCPWVAELRGLLQRWEGARRGSQLSLDRVEVSRSYRKITPVAAPREKRPAEEQGALQAALEKNFFHNQPSALRRTVDFLAERLASNAIRKVRNELVLEERQAAVSALQRLAPAGAPPDAAVLEGAVPGLAQGSLARIRDAHTLFVSLESDTLASLGILISTDTSQAVRETTTAIVGRMVREKVGQYMGLHVTLAYFTREYRCEAQRLARRPGREPAAAAAKAVTHDPAAPPPSLTIVRLKQDLRHMLVDGLELDTTEEAVMALLAVVETSLVSRADLTPTATRALETLTVDWLIALLTHHPALVTTTVLDRAIQLWHVLAPPQLVSLLCPRNLHLLRRAPRPGETWGGLGHLLDRLLAASLLPALALEDSCIALVAAGEELGEVATCLTALSTTHPSLAWVAAIFPREEL